MKGLAEVKEKKILEATKILSRAKVRKKKKREKADQGGRRPAWSNERETENETRHRRDSECETKSKRSRR